MIVPIGGPGEGAWRRRRRHSPQPCPPHWPQPLSQAGSEQDPPHSCPHVSQPAVQAAQFSGAFVQLPQVELVRQLPNLPQQPVRPTVTEIIKTIKNSRFISNDSFLQVLVPPMKRDRSDNRYSPENRQDRRVLRDLHDPSMQTWAAA